MRPSVTALPAQRVVLPFAGLSRNPEAVSVSCNRFRSLVSADKQVGEHSEGVGTRLARACSGSTGKRLSSALCSLTVEPLHPASVSASSITLAFKVVEFLLRMLGLLVGSNLIFNLSFPLRFSHRLLLGCHLAHRPVVAALIVMCGQPQVGQQHRRVAPDP